jgi:hypothetical protein
LKVDNFLSDSKAQINRTKLSSCHQLQLRSIDRFEAELEEIDSVRKQQHGIFPDIARAAQRMSCKE